MNEKEELFKLEENALFFKRGRQRLIEIGIDDQELRDMILEAWINSLYPLG